MKICRYEFQGVSRFGRIEGDTVRTLRAASPFEDVSTIDDRGVPVDSVKLLAPVVPSKIVCIGRNYADHAKELGNDMPAEPLVFLKPPSAVVGPEDTVVRPAASERVDYEGELGIVIGRKAKDVEETRWREFVLGFTCGNDVTARDLQKRDVQFTRAKGFDTFCPLGPWIETDLDVSDLRVVTRLNGEIRQDGRTSLMMFPPAVLVARVSAIMTLEPGDVILTGTPAGVGPMSENDVVEVEIEGIGTLRSRIR